MHSLIGRRYPGREDASGDVDIRLVGPNYVREKVALYTLLQHLLQLKTETDSQTGLSLMSYTCSKEIVQLQKQPAESAEDRFVHTFIHIDSALLLRNSLFSLGLFGSNSLHYIDWFHSNLVYIYGYKQYIYFHYTSQE